MTFPPKKRRPSRLFSWISQLARRASDTSSVLPQTFSVASDYPSPTSTPQVTDRTSIHHQSSSATSAAITLSTSPPPYLGDDDNDGSVGEMMMIKKATTKGAGTDNDDDDDDDDEDSETDEEDDASARSEQRVRSRQLQQQAFPRQQRHQSLQQRHRQQHQQQQQQQARRRPASVFSLPNKTVTEPTCLPRHSCDFEQKRPMSITNSPREPGHQRNDSITTCHCPRSDWPRPDRMIIRQELIRLALDGLYYSPVNLKENSRILHVGCGDGSWCIEIAKRYKDSTVIGMDLHDAIDRSNKKLPSNFKFVHAQKSFLQTLRRQPDNIFDFIFVRFLIFSCPPDMYREVIQECWRVCKPRGFVEMMELDMQIYGNPQVGPITKMLNAQVIYKMQYRALDPHFAQHLQDFFFFHELVEQMHQRHGDAYHAKYTSLPLGVWGGRIGVMFRDDWHDLIEAVHAASPEKDDHDTVAAVMRSRNKSIHPADLGALEDDDDDDDDGSLANYDPWTDQRLKATLEHVDEELETYSSFMNLHHAYAQKH